MAFDVAIKGWVRVGADNERDAKAQASKVLEWLTAEALKRGYDGTSFEEVGLHPVGPDALAIAVDATLDNPK